MNAIFDADTDPIEIQTPFGASSAPIEKQRALGTEVLYLPRHGRNHATKAHRVNYRANIWALRELGVDTIVAGATVGSIDVSMSNGDFVIPDQIIDYTYSREVSFEQDGIEEHFDFTEPFTERVRQELLRASQVAGVDAKSVGTYGCMQGPRFETRAEIARMAYEGCTLVGMTLMPEAALARQVGLDYAAFCLVVNLAAGIVGSIDLGETASVSKDQDDNLRRFIEAFVSLSE